MPTYIDSTILRAMAQCQLKATLRHVYDYSSVQEVAPLLCGSAWHEALAEWLRGKSNDEVVACFDEKYKAWGEQNTLEGDGWHPDVSRELLALFLRRNALETWPYRTDPELVEVGFAFPLDEEGAFIYTGRMDGVVWDAQTNMYYVLDHKTTKRFTADRARGYGMDSQMMGYCWALGHHVGPERVLGALINFIELRALPQLRYNKDGTARKCSSHSGMGVDECRELHFLNEMAWVSYSPEQLEHWQASALYLARQYARLVDRPSLERLQEGLFNGSCAWCEFSPYCAQGQNPTLLEVGYKREKWEPWNVRETRVSLQDKVTAA